VFDKRKEKRAAEEHQAVLQEWSSHLAELQQLFAIASGNSSAGVTTLMLKPGEIGIAQVTQVALVEDRKGAGQWKGSSQAVSFPIAKIGGRSVRYRVGATRGHYVQGAAIPTKVDIGTMTITSQRIVYQGSKKTSECLFTKLLGIQHEPDRITISVSNQQKPTTLFYGTAIDDWVANRLSLALSLFHGEGDDAKLQLQSQINELQATKPA
jgi:hypothetical protein